MPRLHLIVNGRVQGVYFRHSVSELADELGLFGWVGNRGDGAVEIVAEGPRENLERMRTFCEEGPEEAVVSSVQEIPDHETGEFRVFSIRG